MVKLAHPDYPREQESTGITLWYVENFQALNTGEEETENMRETERK